MQGEKWSSTYREVLHSKKSSIGNTKEDKIQMNSQQEKILYLDD